jgi:hypothetical protein
MAFESLHGRKQDWFVVVLPEQTLYCPQHSGVIVDHYDEVSIWHIRHP